MSRETILGENTPVRIGLIIALIVLVIGGICTAVWWASRITTNQEHLMTSQQTVNVKLESLAQLRLDLDRLNIMLANPLKDLQENVKSQGRELQEMRGLIQQHVVNDAKSKTP